MHILSIYLLLFYIHILDDVHGPRTRALSILLQLQMTRHAPTTFTSPTMEFLSSSGHRVYLESQVVAQNMEYSRACLVKEGHVSSPMFKGTKMKQEANIDIDSM